MRHYITTLLLLLTLGVNAANAVTFTQNAVFTKTQAKRILAGKLGARLKKLTVLKKTVRLKAPKKGIQTINGRKPINSQYAGDVHPSGVRFREIGFPEFSPHAKAEVILEDLTGVPRIDNKLANQAAGFGNSAKAPKGYVWHHVDDGRTMQLVPVEIHNATRHTGGAALIRNGGVN